MIRPRPVLQQHPHWFNMSCQTVKVHFIILSYIATGNPSATAALATRTILKRHTNQNTVYESPSVICRIPIVPSVNAISVSRLVNHLEFEPHSTPSYLYSVAEA